MENRDRIRVAYKKWKASLFFDKTQMPLRDCAVLFEDRTIEKKLDELEKALFYGEGWAELKEEILSSVDVLIFPKKLTDISKETAIFNSDSMDITMKKPQYFIDLSPEGHILGTLWVLTFGIKLDKSVGKDSATEGMYVHSYGNRLRKSLINPATNEYTYSPSLFEPYFEQYQSWRDNALEIAKERLNNKQDALILTMDFKSFYYSVDIQKDMFEKILKGSDRSDELWAARLNDLIYDIIVQYAKKVREVHNEKTAVNDNEALSLGNRNFLPIGFLPSNILANYVLTPFDKAIVEKWNPTYYGRYVDDIIIVDKVETNDIIYSLARSKNPTSRLNTDTIIERKLCEKVLGIDDVDENSKPEPNNNEDESKKKYFILPEILLCGESKIEIQGEKVKLFYFQSGATKALLTCFQSKIQGNISEFRMLPDMDAVLQYRDYSELFQIKNEDSINKLRSVTGIELDKFALAKFLGKYRKVGGMIESKSENAFAEDAPMIFDERVLIENYTTWERLFEIFVVNGRIDIVKKLALRIVNALGRYSVPEEICEAMAATHDALLRTLHSALCRSLALTWGKDVQKLLNELEKSVKELYKQSESRYLKRTIDSFSNESICEVRRAYCLTRMINKYVMALPIDCVDDIKNLSDEKTVQLCKLDDISNVAGFNWYKKRAYSYYPYMFLPQDISFAISYGEMMSGQKGLPRPNVLAKEVKKCFFQFNYLISEEDREIFEMENISVEPMRLEMADWCAPEYYATHIGCTEKEYADKLRVAVGNAALSEASVRSALDGKPQRSYERYSQLRAMIDTAITEKVDMLVLPECYVPFEWIPVLSRICANNQMALICGVEHLIFPSKRENEYGTVYNLTAIILPYQRDNYRFAHIAFHNKVECSPAEKELIEGYRYRYHAGKQYQLFGWRNVWFPVYCCFELTSIRQRAAFQSYADLVIAIEWNKDVNYFASIVDSLVRDLHCYCIQANSSTYGDNRVMQPMETSKRDIIKTKGGKNACILCDVIDIKALRDFQTKSWELQKHDGKFKQTPTGLDQTILQHKRNGNLMEYIKDEHEKNGS